MNKIQAIADIKATFQPLSQRVFRTSDLTDILSRNRPQWEWATYWSGPKFIKFLTDNVNLKTLVLRSERYADETRYVWGKANEYEVALSLRKNAYLTHATAVFLHGLNDQIPGIVYVNHEQSPKPPSGGLTQEGIHRAFKSAQRQSKFILTYDNKKILIINGKNTGRCGVGHLTGPHGTALEVTGLERTLIDIAVRPAYAGGVFQVAEAFKRARSRVTISTVIRTLEKLDYLYPYHQLIGFYMERAGYDEPILQELEKLGIQFDFYAAYGLKKNEYNDRWRLFYPRGL